MGNVYILCCTCNTHMYCNLYAVDEMKIREYLQNANENSTLLELEHAAIEFIKKIEDQKPLQNAKLIIHDVSHSYIFISGQGKHRIVVKLVRGSPVVKANFPQSYQ